MIVIGIVGAPAGGKSTVARRLAEHGATWLNADRLAHRCLQLPAVREKIISRFGSEVLTDDGRIDRTALARRVFGADDSSVAALRYLESVVHPPTRALLLRRLRRAAQKHAPATVLDVPLLFESGLDTFCDQVWCVDAPLSQRVAWAAARGWTAQQLARRESRQRPISEKRRLSTSVITNDREVDALVAEVDRRWQLLFDPSAAAPTTDDPHCSGAR